MSVALKSAQREIDAVLKKYGIATYMLCWRDPDDESLTFITEGNRYWRVGVLAHIQQIELASLMKDET